MKLFWSRENHSICRLYLVESHCNEALLHQELAQPFWAGIYDTPGMIALVGKVDRAVVTVWSARVEGDKVYFEQECTIMGKMDNLAHNKAIAEAFITESLGELGWAFEGAEVLDQAIPLPEDYYSY